MRRLLAIWGFCLASLGALTVQAADPVQPPNVLLICSDDLKPALGCYGDPLAQTPNIDRIAARGVVFDKAYCNQAICAPSRNALMTGLRPETLGIYDLSTNFRVSVPDVVTLPQFFLQNGYRTEAVGKISHVGHGNHEDKLSWSVPHKHFPGGTYVLPENRPPTVENAPRPPRGAAFEAEDVPDDAYGDGKAATEAILRLNAAKERPNEPFFLAVGFSKPHLPFCAPKKYWDLYDEEQIHPHPVQTPPEGAPGYAPQFGAELRPYQGIPQTRPLSDELQRKLIHGYYAAVSYMDAQIGRVLDALEANGFADNTIIVFWGDHGWHLGDHGIWCKHTNYEHGTRIPLIIAVPELTSPSGKTLPATQGEHSPALVETVDIYPTLCELAGLTPPAWPDGLSFLKTVRKPTSAPAREFALQVYPRGKRLGRALRTDRYRFVEWKEIGAPDETADIELYDYETDPDETRNLAAEQPEIVAKLREKLAKENDPRPQISAPVAETKE